MRFIVIGAGAIGGVIGGRMVESAASPGSLNESEVLDRLGV